jgi:hypothetical protein
MPSSVAKLDAPPSSPGLPPGEVRVLGLMNTVKHRGPIDWPPRVAVRAYFSEVTIDLRDGVLPPHCVIDLSAWFAEVTIITPPDVHVTSDVYTLLAEEKIKRKGVMTTPAHDAPHVSIVGSAHVAEVRVRVLARGARVK